MTHHKKHWIASNGLVGCIPNTSGAYASKQDAIDWLSDLYSEYRGVKSDLMRYGIWYNPGEYSLEYASIEPCYCDNPDQHNDY